MTGDRGGTHVMWTIPMYSPPMRFRMLIPTLWKSLTENLHPPQKEKPKHISDYHLSQMDK